MSHPLGIHASRKQKSDRRILLKAPSAVYLVNVKIPSDITGEIERAATDPSRTTALPSSTANRIAALQELRTQSPAVFSSTLSNVVAVPVPSEADAEEAIAAILAKMQAATARPAEEYMLVQCFADFTIDFSKRGIYGTGRPVKYVMDFPYYLSLQVNPYVRKREDILLHLEPMERQEIVAAARKFQTFVTEYAAMLSRLHAQYAFFREREVDARRSKKEQERRHFFDLSEFLCFKDERLERNRVTSEEGDAWRRIFSEMGMLASHLHLLERSENEHVEWCVAQQKVLGKRVADSLWVEMLRCRLRDTLTHHDTSSRDFELRMRGLYTETRIKNNLIAAKDADVTPEDYHRTRVVCGRNRHPELYRQADTLNKLVVIGDVYSNTHA